MNSKNKIALKRELATTRNIGVTCGGALNFVSSGWSGGYAWTSRTVDGIDASDFLVTFAVSGGIFGVLFMLMRVGIKVLPLLSRETRKLAVPIWLLLSAIGATVSISTSLMFLAQPRAEYEYFKSLLVEVTEDAESIIEGHARADNLQAVAQSVESVATPMLDNETQTGSVCSVGRGKGECASILESILSTSRKTNDLIVSARSDATPHIQRIRTSLDDVRRLASNEDLALDERARRMKVAIEAMRIAADELAAVIPISAIETLADTLSQEWEQAGIGQVGATRIKSAFFPKAGQLRAALGDIRELTDRQIDAFHEPSPYEVLSAEFESILPLAALATLLDLIPIGMVLILLVATVRNEDSEPSDHEQPEANASAEPSVARIYAHPPDWPRNAN